MTFYNIVGADTLVGGMPEDVGQVLANFQAIAQVVNGNIDNTNIAVGANIDPAKIQGGVPLGGGIPTGIVLPYAGSLSPGGFLMCDGALVSRVQFAALFNVVGSMYGGGDGVNTFAVPDIRGRVIAGQVPGGQSDMATLGQNDGAVLTNRRMRHNHTVGGLTLPPHGHAISDPGHAHGMPGPTANTYPPNFGIPASSTADSDANAGYTTRSAGTGITVGNPTSYPIIAGTIGPGGTNPVDTPSFIILNYIIKT